MEPAAKRLRKLNDFRRSTPHVFELSLSSILNADKLPDLGSRRELQLATALVMDADTPYGLVLQRMPLVNKEGEAVSVFVAHSLAVLCRARRHCEPFAGIIRDKISCGRVPSPDEP